MLMISSKRIAYYRVSTTAQGVSGLGLEAQRKAVRDFNGGDLIEEFTEVESGKRNDRPQLEAALAACRKHKATLLVAKLDRLSRNASFLLKLRDSKVDFKAVDMPEADRFTVGIMALVAEREAETTSKRTREALAAAKARGVKLGNPHQQSREEAGRLGRDVVMAQANKFAENVLPIIDAIRTSGIKTLQGIADSLNARGIQTRRGGDWHPMTVRNILKRAG
jgi:DNA invertase Pin-like site-specific DNA recombinase